MTFNKGEYGKNLGPFPADLMKFLAKPPSAHISAELMNDYWFQNPLTPEERIYAERHLEECNPCQARVENFRSVFPDRVEPAHSSSYCSYGRTDRELTE